MGVPLVVCPRVAREPDPNKRRGPFAYKDCRTMNWSVSLQNFLFSRV